MALETCGTCGGELAADARFCPRCGAPQTRSCPHCGATAEPGARFCSACGQALEPDASEPPPGEERKVVSVLFCDLAGFTAHTERSDPEDVRARLTAYHARVRQDVERFGGRVEKLMGDGVFAVFGVPTAHEDDPERAVRSALRILESVEDLNREQPDLALVVRVAVTTGEAIVQLEDTPDREGIVGDVVNTASRLEGVANPGTVVTDERTFLAARGAIDFRALDPVSLKGKADAVPIWQATSARSRFGVAVDTEPTTPFVGRHEELALLTDAFGRAVARSSPQLVTIVGEPGVGKSRLIREFRRAIDDRPDLVWWRQGRCLPYGEGVTFWAIGELVKAQAGILESEAPAAAGAKLDQAVAALVDDPTEASWITLRLQPLAGTGGAEGAERGELFAAWLRFFEALAARNPLIMVIEDLHWADDPVVEFLDHLLEWATGAPILLVVTARPEMLTDRAGWGAGKRDAATVTLGPLSAGDTARLAASLAGRPMMTAGLQQTLLDRSGGNPLYVTEYVRLAEEQNWFDRADRGEDLPLPDSIHAIITARIDLLSPEDKTLLQTAAVVGRVFWSGALTFADAGTAPEIREGLRRLARRDLVRPVRRSSMQGQEEYTFTHVLIRDVAYERLTRPERARLHESTARWLEAVSGERVEDVAELLAHHLSIALELAPSDDSERRHRAHRFSLVAAERVAPIDPDRAAVHARRAADLASDDRERGRALLHLGDALFSSGGDAADVFDEAIKCFAAAGDREGEANATTRRGRVEWYRGNAEEVDRLDARALELVEGLPPSPVVAEVINAAAARLQLRGHEEEALDLVDRALAIAQDTGDTLAYARCLVTRGGSLVQMGDMEGISDVEEALRIQLDRNDSLRAMSAYNYIATSYVAFGQALKALKLIEEGISYAGQRGLTRHRDWSEMTRAEILFPLGRWDEMLETTTPYLAATTEESQLSAGMASWDAQVRFFRGEVQSSWRRWQQVIAAARDIQDPQFLVPALGGGAYFAWHAGERDVARSLVEEFEAVASEHPVFLAGMLWQVAGPMMALGRGATVVRLLRLAQDPSEWGRARLHAVRALLAEDEGNPEEALRMWTTVIESADRHDEVFSGTMARIEAARSAAACGETETMHRLLAVATKACEAMGAAFLLGLISEVRAESGRSAV